MDEWINQMWNLHIVKYYSALKRNEILIRAITWMNLEDIMLSERSETQKDKYSMHSCEVPRIVKHVETENRAMVTRGSLMGECGVLA